MYYKLTNISGENPNYHGSKRRRIKVGRVVRTVRNDQSIVVNEEDIFNYRFQNEITKDPDLNTWTKNHIFLAEPIIPEKRKKGDISQTPESEAPEEPTDIKEPQTETEKPEDSASALQEDESPEVPEKTEEPTVTKESEEPKVIEEPGKIDKTEVTEESEEIKDESPEASEKTDETKEIEQPGEPGEPKEPEVTEEPKKADEVEETEALGESKETEEIKDESSDTLSPEVKEPSAESESKSQDDDSTNKVDYTVNQLIRMGKGGILKIKLANHIKIPGYNKMSVRGKAEKVIEGLKKSNSI